MPYTVLAAFTADVVVTFALAGSGTLMEPLSWRVLAAVLVAAAAFALILDQIKLPVRTAFKL